MPPENDKKQDWFDDETEKMKKAAKRLVAMQQLMKAHGGLKGHMEQQGPDTVQTPMLHKMGNMPSPERAWSDEGSQPEGVMSGGQPPQYESTAAPSIPAYQRILMMQKHLADNGMPNGVSDVFRGLLAEGWSEAEVRDLQKQVQSDVISGLADERYGKFEGHGQRLPDAKPPNDWRMNPDAMPGLQARDAYRSSEGMRVLQSLNANTPAAQALYNASSGKRRLKR